VKTPHVSSLVEGFFAAEKPEGKGVGHDKGHGESPFARVLAESHGAGTGAGRGATNESSNGSAKQKSRREAAATAPAVKSEAATAVGQGAGDETGAQGFEAAGVAAPATEVSTGAAPLASGVAVTGDDGQGGSAGRDAKAASVHGGEAAAVASPILASAEPVAASAAAGEQPQAPDGQQHSSEGARLAGQSATLRQRAKSAAAAKATNIEGTREPAKSSESARAFEQAAEAKNPGDASGERESAVGVASVAAGEGEREGQVDAIEAGRARSALAEKISAAPSNVAAEAPALDVVAGAKSAGESSRGRSAQTIAGGAPIAANTTTTLPVSAPVRDRGSVPAGAQVVDRTKESIPDLAPAPVRARDARADVAKYIGTAAANATTSTARPVVAEPATVAGRGLRGDGAQASTSSAGGAIKFVERVVPAPRPADSSAAVAGRTTVKTESSAQASSSAARPGLVEPAAKGATKAEVKSEATAAVKSDAKVVVKTDVKPGAKGDDATDLVEPDLVVASEGQAGAGDFGDVAEHVATAEGKEANGGSREVGQLAGGKGGSAPAAAAAAKRAPVPTPSTPAPLSTTDRSTANIVAEDNGADASPGTTAETAAAAAGESARGEAARSSAAADATHVMAARAPGQPAPATPAPATKAPVAAEPASASSKPRAATPVIASDDERAAVASAPQAPAHPAGHDGIVVSGGDSSGVAAGKRAATSVSSTLTPSAPAPNTTLSAPPGNESAVAPPSVAPSVASSDRRSDATAAVGKAVDAKPVASTTAAAAAIPTARVATPVAASPIAPAPATTSAPAKAAPIERQASAVSTAEKSAHGQDGSAGQAPVAAAMVRPDVAQPGLTQPSGPARATGRLPSHAIITSSRDADPANGRDDQSQESQASRDRRIAAPSAAAQVSASAAAESGNASGSSAREQARSDAGAEARMPRPAPRGPAADFKVVRDAEDAADGGPAPLTARKPAGHPGADAATAGANPFALVPPIVPVHATTPEHQRIAGSRGEGGAKDVAGVAGVQTDAPAEGSPKARHEADRSALPAPAQQPTFEPPPPAPAPTFTARAETAPVAPPMPSAAAEIVNQVNEDPALSVAVLSHAAHLSIEGDNGRNLELHVRLRPEGADIRAAGDLAPMMQARANELSMALAAQGVTLGRFELGDGDRRNGRDDAEAAEEAHDRSVAPRRPGRKSSESDSVARVSDGRIHVKA
jgi:hypothetical protein